MEIESLYRLLENNSWESIKPLLGKQSQEEGTPVSLQRTLHWLGEAPKFQEGDTVLCDKTLENCSIKGDGKTTKKVVLLRCTLKGQIDFGSTTPVVALNCRFPLKKHVSLTCGPLWWYSLRGVPPCQQNCIGDIHSYRFLTGVQYCCVSVSQPLKPRAYNTDYPWIFMKAQPADTPPSISTFTFLGEEEGVLFLECDEKRTTLPVQTVVHGGIVSLSPIEWQSKLQSLEYEVNQFLATEIGPISKVYSC